MVKNKTKMIKTPPIKKFAGKIFVLLSIVVVNTKNHNTRVDTANKGRMLMKKKNILKKK